MTLASDISSISFPPPTPVKSAQLVQSRQELEDSPTVKNAPTDPYFTIKRLTALPKDLDWESSVDHNLLKQVTSAERPGTEHKFYSPFAKFLTKISQSIHGRDIQAFLREYLIEPS